ncbi:UDP-glycosyltransferase 84B1 [Euphorbia peplus]|nr:UDP-glycosyltransferase 84B1 [Euphorbia peplus]
MASSTDHEIHILMVSFAAQGHINPLLRLAKRLISKNLHVSLALTEITRHRMFNSSTTSISGVDLLFFSDGLSLDYDRKSNLDFYLDTLGKFGPTNLSKLIGENFPENGRKKLRCIISNPFVPWVIYVAEELGIPCAMFWIQPCSIYAIYYRFYNKLNEFHSNLDDPEMSIELPGLPLLLPGDLPSFVLPTNQFDSIPKLFTDVLLNLKKYDWVLGSSFYELEKDAVDSMSEISPIRPVGPIVPPSLLGEDGGEEEDVGVEFWKAEERCMEWLDKQNQCSVLYVSFGSIVVLPTEQMESVGNALKNSKKPFLWVVKLPEKPTGDGKGELPLGFAEETKDQGLIVSWSPQTRVLAHPSIACFITHCGWNSVLETTVAGVPVIAYPQWTDQPTNAKLVTDVFRTGLRLKANQDGIIGSDEIERCIGEIMDGPKSEEFKSNARKLKSAAREAVAEGGSSDRNIQLFVQEIVERSCLEFDSDSDKGDSGLMEKLAKKVILEDKGEIKNGKCY